MGVEIVEGKGSLGVNVGHPIVCLRFNQNLTGQNLRRITIVTTSPQPPGDKSFAPFRSRLIGRSHDTRADPLVYSVNGLLNSPI